MTFRECAIVEAYTGVCMLTGENVKYRYLYAEEKMGRPVYTHNFADVRFCKKLKEKAREDFIELCRTAVEE